MLDSGPNLPSLNSSQDSSGEPLPEIGVSRRGKTCGNQSGAASWGRRPLKNLFFLVRSLARFFMLGQDNSQLP
jgi:hypothetical protein